MREHNGKTILFGEHFVVYGLPGIVKALDDTFVIHLSPSPNGEYTLTDHTKKFKTAYPQKFTFDTNQSESMPQAIINHLGIVSYLDINLYETIKIATSCMGASAASGVAPARAINEGFKLK